MEAALASAILGAAFTLLGLTALAMVLAMLSPEVPLRALLASRVSGQPEIMRTGFLFANLAMAMTFLTSVIDAASVESVEKLRAAASLFGAVDFGTVTGAASAAYVWTKIART